MNTVRFYNPETNKIHFARPSAAKALKAIGFEIQDEPKIDLSAPAKSEQVSDHGNVVAESSDAPKRRGRKKLNTTEDAVNS